MESNNILGKAIRTARLKSGAERSGSKTGPSARRDSRPTGSGVRSPIAQLWDSLEDHQVQLTPAEQAELERRLATLADDRAQSLTWEALKAELEHRCP